MSAAPLLACFAGLALATRCPLDPSRARVEQTGWEVFGFSRTSNWTSALYNWTMITTIAATVAPTEEAVCLAHSHGVRVVSLVDENMNFTNATARRERIDGHVVTALELGTDGINLDIERFTGDREGLTLYVNELAVALRKNIAAAQLSFDLAIAPDGQTSHYDHRALARALDFIVPMAYDENWGSLTPAANSGIHMLRTGLAQYQALGVPASKLVVALPWCTPLPPPLPPTPSQPL